MNLIKLNISSFFKSPAASSVPKSDLLSGVRVILGEHLQSKLSVSPLVAKQIMSAGGEMDKLVTLLLASADSDIETRLVDHSCFEVIALSVVMLESIEKRLADLEDKAPFVLTLIDSTLRESGPLADYPELIIKFQQQLDSLKSMPIKARSGTVRLPVGPVPTTQEYEQQQQPAGKSFFSWR